MRCRKTVTEKKLAANRENAKRSTGPRTQRGKNTSKFNALITGIFAKFVVNDICDGEWSYEEFSLLLDRLLNEHAIEGALEHCFVTQMAEAMWKLRRATQCENALVRNYTTSNELRPDKDLQSASFQRSSCVIGNASEEIRTQGFLSQAAYPAVLQEVELARQDAVLLEKSIAPAEVQIDEQSLARLKGRKQRLDDAAKDWGYLNKARYQDRIVGNSIAPAVDMDKILQYRKAAQKDFDWALQRLLESQQRRKNTEIPS